MKGPAILSDLGSVIVTVSGLTTLILAVSSLLNAITKLIVAWQKLRKHKK
ncbi:hypothetical protein [Lentilactobacillus kisonensis]|uniref:Uncharacterized protein n=1 Tax=Lentilactobacillus kisonensis F0435 TaxID=797516 RepID=H1LFU6_9LACO|nr:hypothetical protein [Lentilactobacillus kisonensis]EHO51538.1 hypothetical protein HMPREF9104_01472 [Lentilactobacillus kisonensis F0435]